jgi:hypothetical protein
MKPLFPMLLFCLAIAGAAAADEAEAVVRFSNNDRLVGSVTSLSSDRMVWKSPMLEKPAAFFLKHVVDLSLPATLLPPPAGHEATIKLTNGDVVRGQLASVTDDAVALDTWYAGRMNFNLVMIAGVTIAEKMAYLYNGPSGLDGWRQTGDKPAWSYSRSAFRSNAAGSIARDGLLTDECAITFDLAWKGDALGFKLLAFTNDPFADDSSSGYEITFQRGNIYMRSCKTQTFLGSTNVQALIENDKVHICVRASIKTGKICLLVNDRMVEVWSDPNVAKGKFGRCLQFVATTPSPLRISEIGIAPWDGLVDQMPAPRIGMMRQFNMQGGMVEQPKPAVQDKSKEGRMELANGDTLEGEVISIHEGVVTMKTPMGDFKLPVNRLHTITLKKVERERSILRNGDIRARFPDGSSIVFRLDDVGDGVLIGSSQNFGTATFKLAAFSRIEFNIHDPELEDKRGIGDW